jgi:hypothetical protein
VASPSACGTVSGYTLGCGPGGSSFGVPYPAFPFSYVYEVYDVGKAHYNALQVKAETKSARHGIYALVGYTYSAAYDNGLSDGLGSLIGAPYFPLPGWPTLDWAHSVTNLTHSFTGSVIYQLPFGKGKRFASNLNNVADAIVGNWEVTVIEKAISGFPIFVVDSASGASGVAFQNNGNAFMRPNQVCNPTLSHPTLSEWFNTSCFAQPPAGEIGNANRAPVNGPDFVNTDFSVIKHFPIREQMRLDFRAEFFNLFNHPQFQGPGFVTGADFQSPTFATINSTVNNPRVIQFAMKFAF